MTHSPPSCDGVVGGTAAQLGVTVAVLASVGVEPDTVDSAGLKRREPTGGDLSLASWYLRLSAAGLPDDDASKFWLGSCSSESSRKTEGMSGCSSSARKMLRRGSGRGAKRMRRELGAEPERGLDS